MTHLDSMEDILEQNEVGPVEDGEEEDEDGEEEEEEDDDQDDEDDDDDDQDEDDNMDVEIEDEEQEDEPESKKPSHEPEDSDRSEAAEASANDPAVKQGPLTSNLHHYYLSMLQASKVASTYSIYPSAAIPIQTNVNALTVSKGLKYLFLGGADGFIRKFDLLATLQGKLSLTILQKHSLAESISNAGVLMSYWENEIPVSRSSLPASGNMYQPQVSPVYSLEVHEECLFLLSGLQNGGITMQGVRYGEGQIAHYFKAHSNVVNILRLNGTQDKFLSASWDKQLLEWDLNRTQEPINKYKGTNSELSALEYRPLFSTVTLESMKSTSQPDSDEEMDSLFGDEDEDEETKQDGKDNEFTNTATEARPADEISQTSLNTVYDETVFMTAGLNGSVNIWDKRTTSQPVLSLPRGAKVPPWCLSACWGASGDSIFAGRRNACVEEYDLKMPLQVKSTLKLPSISGPVSCVKALPNEKHLLIASRDNIRLYDTTTPANGNPFLIVPGHHGGVISNIYIDPTSRFMISTSGDRGWQGTSTDTTLLYDIDLQ
ncbi:SAGA complex subunit SPT8 KNAG_0L00330 [Huiozyma naganishii CBS 8797]|uniref:Transcription factor spt8 beta-propeller domain-containing protein n=1 Tax=Huiozyma naganishii (strain ATCC MYA-139 / BCRC 22969 / CBS 8797 / KCTC 17520 / NBRC 10181 / NCYC 3082 / Yp74L-3) TaxID=1071383 RepID=J7SB17_HUIN7|nr:hypothetical protein KNAG_0L00330 [Kazachstania naganishii CBS 8797]CCK72656.1 hypothetical protein KNAG_0L00330 [Kazachstania naganishii CBS 8797]